MVSSGEIIITLITNSLYLDPNSVVDFMKSHGMDSSLSGRQHMASQMGINAGPPGSARQNTALLNALRSQQGK